MSKVTGIFLLVSSGILLDSVSGLMAEGMQQGSLDTSSGSFLEYSSSLHLLLLVIPVCDRRCASREPPMISKQLSESSQKSAIAFPLSKGLLPLQHQQTRIETTTGEVEYPPVPLVHFLIQSSRIYLQSTMVSLSLTTTLVKMRLTQIVIVLARSSCCSFC